MMQPIEEICSLIPHRPPFLWVDKVIAWAEDWIVTEKYFSEDLDILRGHYPGKPIMPGVILCEAIFQSGALLMAKRNSSHPQKEPLIPMLTRIGGAKFKRTVFPGDRVEIKVTLTETISNACFFQGTLKVADKSAVTADFVCAMVKSPT